MENLNLRVAKLVGTPDRETWSQVHTFFPEEEEQKKRRGSLLAVLSFSAPPQEEETVAIGREILSRFHEEYYGEREESPLLGLTKAVEKVSQEFSNGEQKLEIIAAALIENVLYLALTGSGQVWVKRQECLEKVLEGEGGPPESKKRGNASGFLKEGDVLVLGTGAFFGLTGEGIFRAALENGEPEEAVEALAPLIQGRQVTPAAAALIAKIQVEEENLFPEDGKEKSTSLFWGLLERLPLGPISLQRPEPKTKARRMVFSLALILLALLFLSLFFGTQKRKLAEKERQFAQVYEELSSLIQEGEALSELNPEQSRKFLLQAQEKFFRLESLKIHSQKTAELKNKIESALKLVVREYQLSEVPLLTDLTLIKEGARGDNFSLSGRYLAILDKAQNRVFGFEIRRKSGEILAGENLTKSQFLASAGDFVFLFEEKGLAQIGIKNKKTERGKIEFDKEWGEIVSLKAYGGNLYLLDKGKGSIWRYQAGEGGFGSRERWLAAGIAPDLSSVVSLAIDGSIWLLTSEGKILKFTQGAPSAFGLAGLDKPFLIPSVIYTDGETKNLYVLDKGNSRVVVLAKSGEYQAQYLWGGISEVSDMVVSEAEKKIFLLSGSKIYEIDLK